MEPRIPRLVVKPGARAASRLLPTVLHPGMNALPKVLKLAAQRAPERSSDVPGALALTAAESRLLPLLSTHLSVPEIATELFLSPHTIKVTAEVDLPEAGRLHPQ